MTEIFASDPADLEPEDDTLVVIVETDRVSLTNLQSAAFRKGYEVDLTHYASLGAGASGGLTAYAVTGRDADDFVIAYEAQALGI